ncbi:4Fe-4S dicluster domain-containing protein [Roseibium sp.]|uniref:4Fe-4S dicluster domain-containing protein n=1 Tax=Roseibium sp. TaxID=1936156 RepID=UPI003A986247
MPANEPQVRDERLLLCNCFKTMDLTASAEALADRLAAPTCSQLCRDEIGTFETALGEGGRLLVACTQEAPLFREIAEEAEADDRVRFVNIRETAGWAAKGSNPTPKIRALIADAEFQKGMRPTPSKPINSDGMCLVYGRGQAALDAAMELEGDLSVTLVLTAIDDIVLPAVLPFPIFSGRIRSLSGALGSFEVVLNGYAPMLPSSRGKPEFLMPRDGAKSKCSVVVDLSGETAPITAPQKRDGYLRAEPSDTVAIAEVLREAATLVGEFEKPLYVAYQADICAHSHAGKTGCSNCLDACPAGAIQSTGEKIAVDPAICGGCGSCAATCPTGAITYQYPYRADLLGRVQTLLGTFIEASGKTANPPVLLLHGNDHGTEMIGALARFGDGLPDNVLPLGMHAITGFGHEAMITAFLAGARRIVLLADPKEADELLPIQNEAALAKALLAGMGHDAEDRIEILVTSDPDELANTLLVKAGSAIVESPRRIAAAGGKRDVSRLAISALHGASANAPDIIALPETAPYGRINVNSEGCTLCLSCVSACPAGALSDNPDRPQISFVETACVQCGLCQTTCPEKVITLEPRFNASPSAMQSVVLHEEEPASCTSCGKAFGTRSTIARIKERLAGKHQMFLSDAQANLIEMCDDCRINAQWNMDESLLHSGGPARPKIRTTDDYLDAAKSGLSVEDFLKEH